MFIIFVVYDISFFVYILFVCVRCTHYAYNDCILYLRSAFSFRVNGTIKMIPNNHLNVSLNAKFIKIVCRFLKNVQNITFEFENQLFLPLQSIRTIHHWTWKWLNGFVWFWHNSCGKLWLNLCAYDSNVE